MNDKLLLKAAARLVKKRPEFRDKVGTILKKASNPFQDMERIVNKIPTPEMAEELAEICRKVRYSGDTTWGTLMHNLRLALVQRKVELLRKGPTRFFTA